MPSRHAIELAPTAFRSLQEIKDKKVRRAIAEAVDALAGKPEAQGKPLVGPLEGLRSVRTVRSRFRVIYRVDPRRRRVSVLLIGPRKPGQEEDVYAVARRLLKTLLSGE